MEFIVRALTRKNIIAIAVGVLLAGAPLIVLNFWVNGLINRQGQEEVDSSARRAVALAESRVAQTIAALDSLAARGVDNCEPGNVEAMRRAVFETIPVKEIAVVGPGGQTLCSDLDLPPGRRNVISSEPLVGANGYSLDLIRIDNNQSLVRLRRPVGGGLNEIAAMVPATQFLPLVSTQGGPFSAYAQIATASGALIGNVGERADAANRTFMAVTRSDKFGFTTEISMSRERLIAGHADLWWLGLFAAGVVIVILAIFSMVIPRRRSGNPADELESALQAGELVPYYQPIVDIRSGQLRGAEVLVRWKKPTARWSIPARSFRSPNRAG